MQEDGFDEKIDNFVRDLTAVGHIAKSEVRRRLVNLLAQERKRVLENMLEIIVEKYNKLQISASVLYELEKEIDLLKSLKD